MTTYQPKTYQPKPGVPKKVRELASALGRRAKGKSSDKKRASAARANALRWEQYNARKIAEAHAKNLKED